MSTRCTINFTDGKRIVAKVYRHGDGDPESVMADLGMFFGAIEADTRDTRFSDPSYLAAKFIVWQARQNAFHWDGTGMKPSKPLDFLGVGVIMENPNDIEFEYFVDSRNLSSTGRPTITYKGS